MEDNPKIVSLGPGAMYATAGMIANGAYKGGTVRVSVVSADGDEVTFDWFPGDPGYRGMVDAGTPGVGAYLIASFVGYDDPPRRRLQVDYIEVDAPYRRRGVATRLYQEAAQYARDHGAALMSDTRLEWEARQFWEKQRELGNAERVFTERNSYYLLKPEAPMVLPNGVTYRAVWRNDDWLVMEAHVGSRRVGHLSVVRVTPYWFDVSAIQVSEDRRRTGVGSELYRRANAEVCDKTGARGIRSEGYQRGSAAEAVWRRLVEEGVAVREEADRPYRRGKPHDFQMPCELSPNRGKSFERVTRIFDESFGGVEWRFPDVGDVELYEDEKAGADNGAGSERQFAYCKDGDPLIIAFAPKAVGLTDSQLRGLMRHEFGHALEYRYGVAELEKVLGQKLPSEVERRADAIAESVWDQPIRYDSKNIQCVGCRGTRPRPAHLPDAKEKLKANPGLTTRPTQGGVRAAEDDLDPDHVGLVGEEMVTGTPYWVEIYKHHPGEYSWTVRHAYRGSVWPFTAATVPSTKEEALDQALRAIVRGLGDPIYNNPGSGELKANPPPGKTFTAYHASTSGMVDKPTEFRGSRGMDYGPGFYLGTEPGDLELYGDRLYEATVRLENPIVISHDEPVDQELRDWLQRALRIDDELLEDHPHPMVGIFAMARTLMQMGEISPTKLIAALQKRGYDGVYVDGQVVNEHQDMGLKGDYLAIWSPEQILAWEEQ